MASARRHCDVSRVNWAPQVKPDQRGPLVSDPMGVKPQVKQVNLAGLGPRLVAGDARDGGGARILPMVDQIDRGLVLRVAGARAHLVGQAGRAGVV